jgi:hypothetical protein
MEVGLKGQVRIVPVFSSFKLVVPPLHPGVLRPYIVWSTWFPSHLPLERTRSYPDLLGCNRRPAVPRVQDPDNSDVN